MRLPRALLALISAIGLVIFALPATAKTLHVVASFTVLADVVKNVGGDNVQVKSLVPANGDPHDFQPSPSDAKALKEADVTFVSGLGLESWFERLARASGSEKNPVVVSEGIETHTFEENGKTIADPHVWNSASNVKIWVSRIEAELSKADPSQSEVFHANAQRYLAKLNALNTRIGMHLAEVPVEQRKVLTSHDAFGYYAKEYGVTFLSPLGVSTETEASAAAVASLIDQIRKEGIKVYFIENSNDARLVKQIANATGAQAGGELYPESLSDANGPVPTYLQMMEYNTQQMVRAFRK
jgi:zinc/manganese transport system substrate-binding protein